MAPIDRNEHRQQRMRGAGTTNVQTSFGFNFGGLASKKQASLPPRRRTPVESTPRGVGGSAKRQRSASVQRNGSRGPSKTPSRNLVTPQLGKRKRGARSASLAHEDDGEADELSPENAPSIEQSRRVAATVSPIREEDDAPDELSFIGDVMSSVQRVGDASELDHTTPVPKVTRPRVSPGRSAPERTPIAGRVGHMSTVSRREIVHSGKTFRPSPTTPAASANHQIRQRSVSASKLKNELTTPRTVEEAEESEDELSPPQAYSIGTPAPSKQHTPRVPLSDHDEVDELSPEQNRQNAPAQQPRASRPRRAVVDEDDEIEAASVISKPRRTRRETTELEETVEVEELDELSPEPVRTSRKRARSTPHRRENEIESIVEELGSVELEDEHEIEEPEYRPAKATKPRPAPKTKARKLTDGEPPRKLQKRGPTQAIQVMRLKGFGVKGLTVVDTTRTVMEEWVTHRISKLTEKLSSIQDPIRAKELRQNRNVVLAYRENLDDVLLELQDANNSGIDNASKLRQFKKENAQLRSDYLALQRDRDEIALETDEITESFMAEKREIEAKNKLSASMYDIEAAIQIGKERARDEGREHEGPEIPVKMLLDDVARGIGRDNGLLGRVKAFNGMMERAVVFLEGRA